MQAYRKWSVCCDGLVFRNKSDGESRALQLWILSPSNCEEKEEDGNRSDGSHCDSLIRADGRGNFTHLADGLVFLFVPIEE